MKTIIIKNADYEGSIGVYHVDNHIDETQIRKGYYRKLDNIANSLGLNSVDGIVEPWSEENKIFESVEKYDYFRDAFEELKGHFDIDWYICKWLKGEKVKLVEVKF